jgi:hydrogenase assembly chaperone HypC/HupF
VSDRELGGCEIVPERCITCGDLGIPMRVISLLDGAAECTDDNGARHRVAAELIASVAVGDWLLVHAGVAIAPLGAGR